MTREEDRWVAREPGFLEVRIEMMRLYRRARRRKLLTLLVALAVALMAVQMRRRKGRSFAASVQFRIVEGDVESRDRERVAPTATRELREYVVSVAMSSTRLLEVMGKHGISPGMAMVNPTAAVGSFREDIGVEVSRNYFRFYVADTDERSARLRLSYVSADPDKAQAVLSDLSELVTAQEDRRRRAQVEGALVSIRQAVDMANADVERRQLRIFELRDETDRGTRTQRAVARVQLQSLEKSLPQAQERLRAAERDLTDLTLVLQVETRGMGLRFEKVDERLRQVTFLASPRKLLILGLIIFLLALPIAAVLVGAFDSRVYDLDDVRRLGILAVGHVPAFPGDDTGSLAARASAAGDG